MDIAAINRFRYFLGSADSRCESNILSCSCLLEFEIKIKGLILICNQITIILKHEEKERMKCTHVHKFIALDQTDDQTCKHFVTQEQVNIEGLNIEITNT